jgi:DNA-binding transcriptional LysR family regulator
MMFGYKVYLCDEYEMDLRQFDLNLLITLDMLLTERSVTGAAARLGRSQPAVSAHLRRLRELFEDPLLTPQRRGLAPTPKAAAIQAPLREALADLAAATDVGSAFEPADSTRVFRIMATDSVHSAVSVPLAHGLAAEAPGVHLALQAPDIEKLESRLVGGDTDIAILSPTLRRAAAASKPFYTEDFCCVARSDHPLFVGGLDLDGFCAAEHILVSPAGGGFTGAVDAALNELGRSRRVRMSVPNFLIVPEVLATSDAIATVPRRVAQRWSDRVALAEPPLTLPTFDVRLTVAPQARRDLGVAWLEARLYAQVGTDGGANV